jgi:DNA-binding transcriptional ArsR family regulator
MMCFNHPPASEIRLERVLYALGDPIRLKIVESLEKGVELACSAASCGLDLAKSTQSYHFRILREAGVIRTRKSGIYYMNSVRREELDARFPGLLDAVLAAAAKGCPNAMGATHPPVK